MMLLLPKRHLLLLLLGMCWVLGSGNLLAQQTITGTVVSQDDESPLVGATVVVEGTRTGKLTDENGAFSIEVPNLQSVLVFSYINYEEQAIPVAGKSVINVKMKLNVNTLDEVVVIGYGAVEKRDLTGSVSSVSSEELNQIQTVSFEQGLAARAPGVQVTSSEGGPGSSAKIRIRGGTSINASNDPLYVIDGFPILGSSQGDNVGLGTSSTSPLASIDPSDIESIEVLKDASATAIYGSRGANGVILITTKSGKKGRSQVNFETYFGVSEIGRDIDILSPQEYVDFWNEYFPYNPDDPTNLYSAMYRDSLGNDIQLDDPRLTVTDWRDRVIKNATVQNYKLSMSGGNGRTNYSTSFSYVDQSGIVDKSRFQRLYGNMKLNQQINKKFKSGLNINMGYTKRNGVVTAAAESRTRNGVLTNVLLFSPVQGVQRRPEAQYDENGLLIADRDGEVTNPEVLINNTTNVNNNMQAFGNAFLEFQPIKGLVFRSTFGGNISNYRGKAWYPGDFGWGRATNGRAIVGTNQNVGWLNENTLSYKTKLGDHGINAVVGFTQQGGTWESLRTTSIDFDIPGVNIDNLAAAKEVLPTNSTRTQWGLMSFLGRVNYTLLDRYLFTATARYDGSSKFAEGNKFGLFPSAAVAWRVSDEPFLESVKSLSNLKLRASYGLSGNQEIGLYRSLASYNLNNAYYAGSIQPGLAPERLANPDLTWETTTQLDVGLELGLFKDRVQFTFDYYNKQTTDLLLEVPVPFTSGFSTTFENLGAVENKGLEFSLYTVNISQKEFLWTSNFNISFNQNKVLDLGDAEEFTVTAIGENRNDYIVRVGESIGAMYGFVADGIYNYDDFEEFNELSNEEAALLMDGFDRASETFTPKEGVPLRAGISRFRPGVIKFKDLNGDGVIDTDDRTIIGNAMPKHFGGFSNNFSYKGFELSVFMNWSYGNDIYNNNRVRGMATAIPFFNKLGFIRDRWTPENPDTDIISIWGTGDGGADDINNTFYIEDGSYLRLSNITFAYNLPKNFLTRIGVKGCRLYVAGDNLHVWTNYTGYDPDVSVGNNQLTPGLDFDSYPRMRTYRMGASIQF
ncbi:TonB-dependent receptor [Pontibacter sp. G13]|uniref:SusC/RagA family TonB-linked outer membrane protein n=1 Tax=Pontibacter sp. G13 TaxID=3074898 RepID=UPI002888FD69|nr:TonB-dependent receptor [Pontibacter sp. G13]WNJ20068.1 TonB-dependent receptor [Pontibacter sp. G13]